jgi:hypothetical protein
MREEDHPLKTKTESLNKNPTNKKARITINKSKYLVREILVPRSRTNKLMKMNSTISS